MRVVHFIHPVDYLQGMVAKRQTGVVADSGIATYGAVTPNPSNVSEYKPNLVCFQGSKGATNGKRWYAIRTKMSFSNRASDKMARAAFGGTASIVKAIKDNGALLLALSNAFQSVKSQYKTFGSYLSLAINGALFGKVATITFPGTTTTKINNPWVSGGTGTDVTIPEAVINKFMDELAVSE